MAVWPRSEHVWPEMVLIVQAETASDAVIVVLHARRVSRAVKVAASAGDGRIYRWYGVTTLVDSFDYQRATCLPMGRSDAEAPVLHRGEDVNAS
ncbi:MAG TPA: hypothetical protein VF043_34290 [Ktedonobacteraceae bacterium]